MSKIESFEDLNVYQSGLSMAIDLYKKLANCKEYSLKDQICRSGVSIPSNIAEGFERDYNKDFIRFLRIAKGSSGELRTQIYIAEAIGIIDSESAKDIIAKFSAFHSPFSAFHSPFSAFHSPFSAFHSPFSILLNSLSPTLPYLHNYYTNW